MSQVLSEKYRFDLDAIQRMEIYILDSLNWRMQAVTPFSYINYFVDKFTDGKPLSCGFISRCTEIILGSLEGTSDYFMHERANRTYPPFPFDKQLLLCDWNMHLNRCLCAFDLQQRSSYSSGLLRWQQQWFCQQLLSLKSLPSAALF
jgi:hypothetical protein